MVSQLFWQFYVPGSSSKRLTAPSSLSWSFHDVEDFEKTATHLADSEQSIAQSFKIQHPDIERRINTKWIRKVRDLGFFSSVSIYVLTLVSCFLGFTCRYVSRFFVYTINPSVEIVSTLCLQIYALAIESARDCRHLFSLYLWRRNKKQLIRSSHSYWSAAAFAKHRQDRHISLRLHCSFFPSRFPPPVIYKPRHSIQTWLFTFSTQFFLPTVPISASKLNFFDHPEKRFARPRLLPRREHLFEHDD